MCYMQADSAGLAELTADPVPGLRPLFLREVSLEVGEGSVLEQTVPSLLSTEIVFRAPPAVVVRSVIRALEVHAALT